MLVVRFCLVNYDGQGGKTNILDGMKNSDSRPSLKLLLHDRFEWCESKLFNEHIKRQEPRLTPAQHRVMAALRGHECSISDLSRKLDLSRQAVHKTVAKLVDVGWLELRVLDKKNEKTIFFTEKGEVMRAAIVDYMDSMERQISEKIGADNYQILVKALDSDWGD